jgi:hypothetical protein
MGGTRMQSYYIAFWNVENLFDVENSDRRPEWLQRTLEHDFVGLNRTGIPKGPRI